MSSTSELDARRYLEALKELLRERGVTYADLAKGLGCSLPTVKRALNKPSLPLDRLLEFCELAHVPFDELHRRAERERPTHHVFSDEQDLLFFEREELFLYLLELAGGATPSDIATRHGLDERSTRLYLEHLARVGLVGLDGETAKLLEQPPFGFGPGSRVLSRDHKAFMESVLTTVLEGDPRESGAMAVLKPLRLAPEDYHQMVREAASVVDRFAAVSERAGAREDASPWQIAIACGPGPVSETRRLPRITE